MLNLFISLAAGVVVSLLVVLLHFSALASIAPGVIAALGVYLLLARRYGVKFQGIVSQAQKELASMPNNARERQQRIERAIRTLESGLALAKWQFFIAPQVHSQIGMLRYMTKDFDAAAKHLSQASGRDAMAHAFQAALQFQKKNAAGMKASFETAVKAGRKEGLVWAAYAWCLFQLKEKDKALEVMGRAVTANPSDERLKSLLTALQNDKRLKMKAFEPMWWQFGLEQPPVEVAGGRRAQFQRH